MPKKQKKSKMVPTSIKHHSQDGKRKTKMRQQPKEKYKHLIFSASI